MPNISFLDVKIYSYPSASEPPPQLVILSAQSLSYPSHSEAIGCSWDLGVGWLWLFCCGLLVSNWLVGGLLPLFGYCDFLGYLSICLRNWFCLGFVWFGLGSNYATLACLPLAIFPGPPGCWGYAPSHHQSSPPFSSSAPVTSLFPHVSAERNTSDYLQGTHMSNGFAQLRVLTPVSDLFFS